MPLVDERGRLFGRVNLIDAGVGVLVLLLIPLGYAAYVLFRTPIPTITSVERVPVPGGEGYRLRVLGEDLRPYLRATLGTQEATFLVESPNAGEVSVPELGPGTYDLVVYDVGRELTRVPGALIVDAPVDPSSLTGAVKVLGWFTGLDERTAQSLAGARNAGGPSPVRFVRLQPTEPDLVPLLVGSNAMASVEGRFRVNALLILQCTIVNRDCFVGDTPVQPGELVTIPYAAGTIRFRVEEVHSAATELIDVRVRFVTQPEILAELRREAARVSSSTESWGLTPWFVSFEETISGVRTIAPTDVTEQITVVRAVVRVPADRTVAGWKYRSAPLGVGGTFEFATSQHVISSLIMSIRAPEKGPTVSAPSD